MFGNAFGWPHLLIILVILLLLFGAPKLPALAKSIAQSMKIFKTEMTPNSSASGGTAAPTAAPTSTDDKGTTPGVVPGSSTDYPPKV